MTVNQPNLITNLNVDLLLEAAKSNDDLGVVLRAHMEFERAMIRLLEVKFPNYGALEHNSFKQHLKSLRALGATGPLFRIADQVNVIRNRMAHVKGKDIKTALTDKDLKELCSQASGVFGGLKDVLDFVATIGSEGPKTLRQFSRAKQFLAIASMAAAAIDTIPQRELAA
jgi:hypothetical protein